MNTHTRNTQKKVTLERVSWYENKWYLRFLFFLKQPHLFYQRLHIYGKKNLNPPPLSPLIKEEGGSNYALAFSS